jgi:hypothetical protein
VPTIAQLEPVRVTLGVDTHKDAHVAVAKDHLGRHLGETTIPTTLGGYRTCWRGLKATVRWIVGASKAPAPTGQGYPGSCGVPARS